MLHGGARMDGHDHECPKFRIGDARITVSRSSQIVPLNHVVRSFLPIYIFYTNLSMEHSELQLQLPGTRHDPCREALFFHLAQSNRQSAHRQPAQKTATMEGINQETGESMGRGRSPRFTLWVAFLTFAAITMGAAIEVVSHAWRVVGAFLVHRDPVAVVL